jgi:hypothetical protein
MIPAAVEAKVTLKFTQLIGEVVEQQLPFLEIEVLVHVESSLAEISTEYDGTVDPHCPLDFKLTPNTNTKISRVAARPN